MVWSLCACDPGSSPDSPSAIAEKESAPSDGLVRLGPDELTNAGLTMEQAGARPFRINLARPATVEVHPARRGTVISRLSGVATRLLRDVGDRVAAGEALVLLESRELSDLRLAFHETHHHLEYLEAKLARASSLRERNLSAEQEFLDLEHEVEEARIAFAMARGRLILQGAPPEAYEEDHPEQLADGSAGRYELRSPFDGTIIARAFERGELVETDRELYRVADLERLVAEVPVPTVHAGSIVPGGEVRVISTATGLASTGLVERVLPTVDARARTVTVRVELPAGPGWLPGMSATAELAVAGADLELAVPAAAVRSFEDGHVVFVRRGEGLFEARRVQCGRRNEETVEILSGLAPGDEVVTEGSLFVRERWLSLVEGE